MKCVMKMSDETFNNKKKFNVRVVLFMVLCNVLARMNFPISATLNDWEFIYPLNQFSDTNIENDFIQKLKNQ